MTRTRTGYREGTASDHRVLGMAMVIWKKASGQYKAPKTVPQAAVDAAKDLDQAYVDDVDMDTVFDMFQSAAFPHGHSKVQKQASVQQDGAEIDFGEQLAWLSLGVRAHPSVNNIIHPTMKVTLDGDELTWEVCAVPDSETVHRSDLPKQNPPRGLTDKGKAMYERVKAAHREDPAVVASRTVAARARAGVPGLVRKNPDDGRIDIRYYTVPNANVHRGGHMPMISINGRPYGDTYGRGSSEAEALEQAKILAEEEASRYVGDWNITITEGAPLRRNPGPYRNQVFTAKGERMYQDVKAEYERKRDPRASEIAARTVFARARDGVAGLVKNPSSEGGQDEYMVIVARELAARDLSIEPLLVGADWIRDTWALRGDYFLVAMDDGKYSLVKKSGREVEPLVEDVSLGEALGTYDSLVT